MVLKTIPPGIEKMSLQTNERETICQESLEEVQRFCILALLMLPVKSI